MDIGLQRDRISIVSKIRKFHGHREKRET